MKKPITEPEGVNTLIDIGLRLRCLTLEEASIFRSRIYQDTDRTRTDVLNRIRSTIDRR